MASMGKSSILCRAEVIVGRGYPYAIETADQVAVIQGQDRQQFYRLLQQWAEDGEDSTQFFSEARE